MRSMDLGTDGEQTRKLYYEDSHLSSATARVIDVICNEKYTELVLDQTLFFPEGGGQTSDIGWINDVPMLHAREEKGIIYHRILEKSDVLKITVGDQVSLLLDYSTRFSNMQNHSGEHIVSGLIFAKYGFTNVGFHMGSEAVTLDLDGAFGKEALIEIEKEANRIVWENVPVTAAFPTPQELEQMNYRSKLAILSDVRIVSIGENGCYDRCACCAPHVSRTGEIGQIRLLDVQNYKGGMRISMLCGERAYDQGRVLQNTADELCHRFSVKEKDLKMAVERLEEEKDSLYQQRLNLMQRYLRLRVDTMTVTSGNLLMEEELEGDDLRFFANLLCEKCTGIVFLLGKGGRYILASPQADVREFQKKLAADLGAKGGGSPKMVTGRISAEVSAVQEWFRQQ